MILREDWLDPMGITAYRAAKDMGVPPNRLTAILAGERGIAADTALRLARYFGTEARSWINLQSDYDLAIAALTHGAAIERTVKPRRRLIAAGRPHGPTGTTRSPGAGDASVKRCRAIKIPVPFRMITRKLTVPRHS